MPEKPQDAKSDPQTPDRPAAPWVQAALAGARSVLHQEAFRDLGGSASEAFLTRCTEAAHVAAELAKLRQAREHVGFLPFPVLGYLERLGRRAGVGLAPILAWARIDRSSTEEPGFARGWARLAREIGVSLREARVQLRLSFVEVLAPDLKPVLVRRRAFRRHRATVLEQYEASLDKIVSRWSGDALAQLRAAEAEVRSAYGEDR